MLPSLFKKRAERRQDRSEVGGKRERQQERKQRKETENMFTLKINPPM